MKQPNVQIISDRCETSATNRLYVCVDTVADKGNVGTLLHFELMKLTVLDVWNKKKIKKKSLCSLQHKMYQMLVAHIAAWTSLHSGV